MLVEINTASIRPPRSEAPGRLQDQHCSQVGFRGPPEAQVPLPQMHQHLQQEEQPLLAPQVRVWPAAAIRLSLLRLRVEEVVEHPRARAQEALRVQSWRRGRVT
ncbi:uncharacterized protein LOC143181512 isoform X1 [Calliopsis andreniformis]|uniref:uncharacterized protein LOC143181512 isoform X1 n=1 Tax=Calliopsis andreniformis TaxID=337506 RepID=UPI003FCE7F5C